MSTLLEVEGLTKSFGGVRALSECGFEVREGTVTALIGPNGSGKTTAFNVITGYQPADAGSLTFRGRAVRRPDPCRLQRLGLARTFQQARVFPGLTAVENVVLGRDQSWHSLLRRRVSGSEPAARPRAARRVRPGGPRGHNRRTPVLRTAQAARVRQRAHGRTHPHPARRTRRGHQPDHGQDDGGPYSTPTCPGCHLPHRRARDEVRDAPVRPRHRA